MLELFDTLFYYYMSFYDIDTGPETLTVQFLEHHCHSLCCHLFHIHSLAGDLHITNSRVDKVVISNHRDVLRYPVSLIL